MFKEMEEAFKEQVFSLVSTMQAESPERKRMEASNTNESRQNFITSHTEPIELGGSKNVALGKDGKEIGRNDPCPCGAINPATGEVYKYKKCGLINAPQHRKSLIN